MHRADPAARAERDAVVVAADGYELAATFYDAGDADTAVLVNSATAVPRRFYRRFARFLQRHGWHVLTYDYRGIGGSRPPSLCGFKATMSDWAFLDMTAAVNWIARELAPARLFAVGHSFGGASTRPAFSIMAAFEFCPVGARPTGDRRQNRAHARRP